MSVRREVTVSVALSTLALIGIGAAGLVAARTVATDEALKQAVTATELLARAVIQPAIDEGLVDGREGSIAKLDRAVQSRVLGDQVLTVRVWAPDGTVLYTDDLSTIGRRFALGEEEHHVLATGQSHADLSELDKAENVDQSDFGQLLEVYVAADTADGARLLVETYQSTGPIAATTQRVLRAFAPVVLGGLVLFGLVQGLLAWRLARRLGRLQQDRERLMRQALEASELERRSIAADLHDGVVQDLVGLTFALDALAVGDLSDEPAEAGAALATAAGTTRRSVRSLRSLLVEIYPPNLDRLGLRAALTDLVAATEAAGIQVELELDDAVALSADARAAVYRTVREALSNVRRHSRATRVVVRVDRGPAGSAACEVIDNGVGFDPGRVPANHVGLRLLDDLAASVGGRLSVDSPQAGGTTVRLEVPGG